MHFRPLRATDWKSPNSGVKPSWRFLLLSSSEVKGRLRGVRRELEGVIRGLTREAAMMENELARIEAQAERAVLRLLDYRLCLRYRLKSFGSSVRKMQCFGLEREIVRHI